MTTLKKGEKVKVLQINANYGFGSTGVMVKDIGDILNQNGHDAYFAYQRTTKKIENGYQIGNIPDWKWHALMTRVLGRQGYCSIFATKRFLNYIDKIKPDVVHLHNLHSNYINLDMLLKYLSAKDIPTVITLHDCWFFTGKCFHYADVGCDGFMRGCGNCKKKKSKPGSLFFDCSSRVLKDKRKHLSEIPHLKVVGCSKWICGEAKKGILKDFDVTCIYNGTDTTIFFKKENDLKTRLNVENEFLVMGMADKWMSNENIGMIKKVAAMQGIRLMLVGCNQNQKEILKTIDKSIIAIGYISDREELAKYYNVADVFVNLTHADTFPTVNMESICCATPVITYDSCGSPEAVGSDFGIVVRESDEDAIIKAIDEIKSSDGYNFQKNGADLFDKNKSYRAYLDVYKELL